MNPRNELRIPEMSYESKKSVTNLRNELRIYLLSNVIKMLDICIMGLLRMRMDALHYALLAALVLLVLYAARSHGMFKEGARAAHIPHVCQTHRCPDYIPNFHLLNPNTTS